MGNSWEVHLPSIRPSVRPSVVRYTYPSHSPKQKNTHSIIPSTMLLKFHSPHHPPPTIHRYTSHQAPGTHPWSQGFPLTTPLEQFGGPALPSSVEVTWEDRFYPKAPGHPALREAIADYYNTHYGCSIAPENVFVSAGGRAGIFAILRFLKSRVKVLQSCNRLKLTNLPSVRPSAHSP